MCNSMLGTGPEAVIPMDSRGPETIGHFPASSFIENPTGTTFSSWTVMSKTMIGGGMLGLSYALSQAGWGLGIFLFILAACLAMFALHLLNIMSMHSKSQHVTFYTVAESYAPKSRWIVDLAIAVKCLGVGISYLQICGTMMTRLIVKWSGSSSTPAYLRPLVVCVACVLLAPVCLQRKLSKTKWVNMLGIMTLIYVSILAIVYSDVGDAVTSVSPVSVIGTLSNLGVFIFTFTCHQNMFLVAEDMKDRSQKKLDFVAITAELTAFLVFIPALILPYATFGSDVKTNFLENLNEDNIPVQIGFLLLSIAEVCSFPLQLFPTRKSICVLYTKGRFYEHSEKFQNTLRYVVTIIVLIISAIMASVIESLGVIFSVVGIIGSNTISFIMPSFLFICMIKFAEKHPKNFKLEAENVKVKYYLAVCLFVVAVTIIPVALTAIIYKAVTG